MLAGQRHDGLGQRIFVVSLHRPVALGAAWLLHHATPAARPSHAYPGGSYAPFNSLPDSVIVDVDNSVASPENCSYRVKSMDSTGVESVALNQITVTIPSIW
jgi:hypothetical protein